MGWGVGCLVDQFELDDDNDMLENIHLSVSLLNLHVDLNLSVDNRTI